MAKRYRIPELEKEYGDLHKIIPPLVNEGGQAYAAFQLDTTQATISRWLRDNGYAPKTTYEKQERAS